MAISFVTGIHVMFKPEVMWKTCRSHQLELESELFKFRTESGEYGDQLPVAQVVDSYKQRLFEIEKKL